MSKLLLLMLTPSCLKAIAFAAVFFFWINQS